VSTSLPRYGRASFAHSLSAHCRRCRNCPTCRPPRTPQQFDAFIKSELKRWPEVVRAAGIKPQ
jgi:hypothetical protein